MIENCKVDDCRKRLLVAVLEHVTELLVDTWAHKMDGDPEHQIAVIDARAALSVPQD